MAYLFINPYECITFKFFLRMNAYIFILYAHIFLHSFLLMNWNNPLIRLKESMQLISMFTLRLYISPPPLNIFSIQSI